MKIFLLIIILLFTFNCAFACSNYAYPNLPVNFIAAKVGTIYIGKVISNSVTFETDEDGIQRRVYRTKVKVEKSIKGTTGEIRQITITESVNKNTSSCDYERPKFKKGQRWVIHENYQEDIDIFRLFITSPEFHEYWRYDLLTNGKYVEDLEKVLKNPVTAIYGQIQAQPTTASVKDAEVKLEGNNLKLTTRTNDEGKYMFENISPGNYKIKIPMPFEIRNYFLNKTAVLDVETQTYNFEFEIELKSGDSDFHYILINDFSGQFQNFFKFTKQ